MPKVQNFDGFPSLVDAIVDVDRRVQKAADIRLALDSGTYIREGCQKLKVIEQVYAKLLGAARMLFP